jgi:5-methyltetrahydropteroyltriglutamate--homocysteine methyltransferase
VIVCIALTTRILLRVVLHFPAIATAQVEFFGQQLAGFTFTSHGWVQSYGSRCVRPPIITSDVSRPRGAMTVREYAVAQSLTRKPVKGMLTGPVTILNWSFPRADVSRAAQALQLAHALREEVSDLEAAGCAVLQVDEPALREGLPLKRSRWDAYLSWATAAFRLATSGASPRVMLVTHLCYSDFQDILPAIEALDADVLAIESSRSGDTMLRALAAHGYARDVGPGVYDVHSPVVPPAASMRDKLRHARAAGLHAGAPERLWVVPDCGLKTRTWEEVLPSLRHMVAAARQMREEWCAEQGKQQPSTPPRVA